jgi:sarcosine oxidase, subunit gamma
MNLEQAIRSPLGHLEPTQPSTAAAAGCTLSDLSTISRVGFRGADAVEYLKSRDFSLPDAPNQALDQPDGSLIARLSHTEYLVLGSLQDAGARVQREEQQWRFSESANYLLPRADSHAWLLLRGPCIAEVMAKLCGVDLRDSAFAPGAVAQTSAARISVILIRPERAATPCLHLLCDRASAHYFHGALLDAMQEFAGVVIPMEMLKDG